MIFYTFIDQFGNIYKSTQKISNSDKIIQDSPGKYYKYNISKNSWEKENNISDPNLFFTDEEKKYLEDNNITSNILKKIIKYINNK